MVKEITCIICPNGCDMICETKETELISIEGNLCPKGVEYVKQELTNPQRTISTSVLVEGGELPLVSVRLTKPIPKKDIFRAMEEIKKIRLKAPVTEKTVVIHGILGTDSDVIATKTVAERKTCV